MDSRQKIASLRRRDGDLCWLCGGVMRFTKPRPPGRLPPDEGTVEHIVERWRGGSNRLANLALTHNSCNSARDRYDQHIRMFADPAIRHPEHNHKRRWQRYGLPMPAWPALPPEWLTTDRTAAELAERTATKRRPPTMGKPFRVLTAREIVARPPVLQMLDDTVEGIRIAYTRRRLGDDS